MCSIVLPLLPVLGALAQVSFVHAGDVEPSWTHPDIILEGEKWTALPDEFVQHGPIPYPPKNDYGNPKVRNASTIAVLVASFRESRIVDTLVSIYQRAFVPSRVFVGIVQQNGVDDEDALEGFCKRLGTPLRLRDTFRNRADLQRRQTDEDAWGHQRYTEASLASCEPAKRIRMYRMDMVEAKGPAYARARQPLLLNQGTDEEDFCLQIDAHSVFPRGWDEEALRQWASTKNEYAVMTTYPSNANDLKADGTPININNHWEMPHLCDADIEGGGVVHNAQAGAAANLRRPALTKLWGAGLSFSRCHAERDVPADPEMRQIFTGEEFSRGARLWTNGYDFYTPSRPIVGTYYGNEKAQRSSWEAVGAGGAGEAAWQELSASKARMASLLRAKGADLSTAALTSLRGFGIGARRGLEDYLALCGLDLAHGKSWHTPCSVTRWTPWLETAQGPYEPLDSSPSRLGVALTKVPVAHAERLHRRLRQVHRAAAQAAAGP